jgi:hypothetical protein
MPHRLRLFALSVSLLTLAALAGPLALAGPSPGSAEASAGPECARTAPEDSPGSAAGGPCWVDVHPYPFGSEGKPVDTSPGKKCAPEATGEEHDFCYLTVTSMAFRAWNRGLAATVGTANVNGGERAPTPYGVWLFNGTSWFPDPTFLGQSVCKGTTIVWAGEKDYWLVGGPNWANLCRFDGFRNLAWASLEVPAATLLHASPPGSPSPKPRPGSITSAACFSWDNCWFFGTYGTVVHWDGKALTDASPASSQPSLQGEYTAAAALHDAAGSDLGVAAGATSESLAQEALKAPNGAPPPQLYSSSGGAFSPLSFTPFTFPGPGDPYRTDLVAVAMDSAGQGWVAGNPAGLRTALRTAADQELPASRFSSPAPQPSPLEPVSLGGAASGCEGPPESRFMYSGNPLETATTGGAFLWSSLGVVPGTGEALAGGRMRRAPPGSAINEDAVGEPVIVRAGCAGTTSVTRFRLTDPTNPVGEAPADHQGTITALAANADNDAWAATTKGSLRQAGSAAPTWFQRPHLYRLTNGLPPDAPGGDDNETRPPELQEDASIFEHEPPPPPAPPPAPAIVSTTHTVTLPPAVYGVKVRLHIVKRHGRLYLSLYLTFKLRRPVTIGARALRHRRVVSVAAPRHFAGRSGLLILRLDRKHWPTAVGFIT